MDGKELKMRVSLSDKSVVVISFRLNNPEQTVLEKIKRNSLFQKQSYFTRPLIGRDMETEALIDDFWSVITSEFIPMNCVLNNHMGRSNSFIVVIYFCRKDLNHLVKINFENDFLEVLGRYVLLWAWRCRLMLDCTTAVSTEANPLTRIWGIYFDRKIELNIQ